MSLVELLLERTCYLTCALVPLIKRKQENLPSQIGFDAFKPDRDTAPFRLFLKFFDTSVLRVRADDNLRWCIFCLRKVKLRAAGSDQKKD